MCRLRKLLNLVDNGIDGVYAVDMTKTADAITWAVQQPEAMGPKITAQYLKHGYEEYGISTTFGADRSEMLYDVQTQRPLSLVERSNSASFHR